MPRGLPYGLDYFFRRVGEVVGGDDRQAGPCQDVLAEIDVGALQPDHERHAERHFAGRGDDPLGDHVAAHDAAEDVHQDTLDVRIGENDLERRRHLLLGCAAADIEEVCGRCTVELDDVHRGHREPGAIHHAADRAVQGHVVEVVLGRFQLLRIFLRLVTQLVDLGMPEQRVVVEAHLRIQRDHLARTGDDQRVDLDDRAVQPDKGLIHRRDEFAEGGDLLACEAEPVSQSPPMKAGYAGRGIDRPTLDLLRVRCRHLLDLHAPFRRSHDRDA